MKTRLTPMFVNHSTVAKNTVYTPFPQVALAFLTDNDAEYLPDTGSALVSEFAEFWSMGRRLSLALRWSFRIPMVMA